MNFFDSFSNVQKESNMDMEEISEIKSYNFDREYSMQKESQRNISNTFSSISIVSNFDKDEVSELKSYNYNCKYINLALPSIFEKNNDDLDNNLSNNIIACETNGISQESRTLFENKNIKEIFCIKITNKIDKSSPSIDNIQENIKKQNTDNNIIKINNSKINEENNNIFIYEETEKKNIFKVVYSKYLNNSNNTNNSIIFTDGNFDNFSSYMLNRALNNVDKNSQKVKNKKIFEQIPKKPKKKKKNIQKRKENSDNIRKKIKARFLKALKNAINQKLKNAGSKYIFQLLPQSFITNLSKDKNKEILNLSLKDIFLKNFDVKEKQKRADFNKYKHNLFVMDYLEKNNNISEKSNFNRIKKMKYSEIFDEYLLSKEFESEISNLKQQRENDKYIKDYIIKARNFIDFFNHQKK